MAGKWRWIALMLLAALAASPGPSFASRSVALVESGRMQLVALDNTTPFTAADVRRAILLGGQARAWNAIGEAPGVITLQVVNDQHRLVVDVAYDADSFDVKYKSSLNLRYDEGGGHPTIHPTALRWIGELNNAIRKAALAPRGAGH
jgi:hypothetical protein